MVTTKHSKERRLERGLGRGNPTAGIPDVKVVPGGSVTEDGGTYDMLFLFMWMNVCPCEFMLCGDLTPSGLWESCHQSVWVSRSLSPALILKSSLPRLFDRNINQKGRLFFTADSGSWC